MAGEKSFSKQVDVGFLPPPIEDFDEKKGVKTITEYKNNDEGKLIKEKLEEETKKTEPPPASSASPAPKTGGKYIPPNLREGANKGRGESMATQRKEEAATIMVTNLSEETRESHLQELFRPFGPISRVYLPKNKNTGQPKGFAFIKFHRREDAAKAIQDMAECSYDHPVLNVQWATPST